MRALAIAAVFVCLARAGEKDRKYYYEDIYSPFFAVDPDDSSSYKNVRPGSAPGSFLVHKTSSTFRVFTIGGSTTLGYMGFYDLAHGLQLALPSLNVEVVNAGMSGYDSYRELLVEEQVLAYDPDALVFLTGHNDFAIKKSRPHSYWALRVDDFMSRFSWWEALHRRFDGFMRSRREPTHAESMAELVRNARQHARLAAKRGVKAVFCSPPINYRDNAPEARLPVGSAAFMRGWIPYLRRDWARARAAWLTALDNPGNGDDEEESARAFILFGLARCEEKLGRLDDARRRYYAVVDSGMGYNWCAGSCVDALKTVARDEGALWADAEGAFRKAAFPRMPGLDMLNDKIHWRSPYHRLVTEEVIAALRADPKFASLPWDMENLKRSWSRSSGDVENDETRLHVEQLIRHATEDSKDEVNLSIQSVVYLQALEELWPSLTRDPEALFHRARAHYEQEVARPQLWEDKPMLDVAPAEFDWNFGEFELERGRYEQAAGCFRKTLALEPRAKFALLNLAIAQELAGRRRQAQATLSRAVDADMRHYAEVVSAALGIPLDPNEAPSQ